MALARSRLRIVRRESVRCKHIHRRQKLRFRYRVVIHPGDVKSAGIAALWDEYLK